MIIDTKKYPFVLLINGIDRFYGDSPKYLTNTMESLKEDDRGYGMEYMVLRERFEDGNFKNHEIFIKV